MFFAIFFSTVLASLQLSAVSFCFLLIFCNIDPLVFVVTGTTSGPSLNTNVNASSPNINVDMLPSATTTAVIPLSNTQQVINLKLTNSNYLFWHIQMKPYLIGQGVFSFVNGSYSCSLLPLPILFLALPKCLSHGNNKINSYSMIYYHPSPMIFFTLRRTAQLRQSVWSTLEHSLGSPSNSRIIQLHGSLQDLCQDDDIVTLYLQKAKG